MAVVVTITICFYAMFAFLRVHPSLCAHALRAFTVGLWSALQLLTLCLSLPTAFPRLFWPCLS
eukprot:14689077-Alexandrium_andersonii.AAC.1